MRSFSCRTFVTPFSSRLPAIGSLSWSRRRGLATWWAEDIAAAHGSAAVELGCFDRAATRRLVLVPDSKSVRWRCETGKEWAGTDLVFHMQDKGPHTQVEFSHESWAEVSPYFVSCNKVWGHLMFKLKDAAERGGPPRPLFTKSGMETPTFTPGAY
jgi:hypothetical protein